MKYKLSRIHTCTECEKPMRIIKDKQIPLVAFFGNKYLVCENEKCSLIGKPVTIREAIYNSLLKKVTD